MRVVGDHLADEAELRGNATEFDLFCRSAFNRYYYSAFLTVRRVLKTLDPVWATPTHKGVPDLLTGEVLNRLKRHIKHAQKNGLINPAKGQEFIRTAGTAASELSNLLTSARETRRLADYEPETLVSREGTARKLGEWTLEAARNWERRVEAQSKTILKIYADIGLI